MAIHTVPRPAESLSSKSHSKSWDHSATVAPITIAATATALPEYVVTIDDVRAYADKVFPLTEARLAMVMEVIENAKVERRYCILPPDYVITPRSLEQVTLEYQEHSILLGRRVAADCLKNAGLAATDIDVLITVSCTGIMIPSLDAHLINDLGFRSDVRRLPITELGCAAGAASLGRAWDFLKGVPEGNVLIVSVEIPTMTFQRGDFSPANLISCILFGDGAAAAVVGRGGSLQTAAVNGNGHWSRPRIIGTKSYLFPNSIDAMGFDLKDTGLHIVLSKDVPQLIRDRIAGLVDNFLAEQGLQRSDIAAFVLHPGGQKLLSFIEEEMNIPRHMTQYSWDVLRDYGNLSSASVLFVLQEWMTKAHLNPGDYGLLAAFGPGFSAEMMLLQWT
jgi:alkylresorcinol/alkylpyrone synthase